MEENKNLENNLEIPKSVYVEQKDLPNYLIIIVLAAKSILLSCAYGVPGLILSIVALVMANKDEKLYMSSPMSYTASSYKNLRTGKTLAIIGLVLSGILTLVFLVFILIYGALIITQPFN